MAETMVSFELESRNVSAIGVGKGACREVTEVERYAPLIKQIRGVDDHILSQRINQSIHHAAHLLSRRSRDRCYIQ